MEGASKDTGFLQTVLYLAEKTSEHPIAQSICQQVLKNIPNVETQEDLELVKFSNRNGEGIVATVKDKRSGKPMEVMCGNTKLMAAFKVLDSQPELARNIGYLEQEGKTVLCLSIDNLP